MEFTYKELEKARKSRKITRWQLANECGVSESTVERWEKGEKKPDPDDISKTEKFLKIPGLWGDWMFSNCASYRERNIMIPRKDNMTEIICRMKYEVDDITPLFNYLEREALDGEFNDVDLWKKFKKEALEAKAAILHVLDRIPDNI